MELSKVYRMAYSDIEICANRDLYDFWKHWVANVSCCIYYY
jgi:hypothetical protein